MRTLLSWLMIAMLGLFSPMVMAQEEEGGEPASTDDSGSSGSDDSAADPWEAPSAGETTEETPKEAPEIVIPDGYPVNEVDRPLALPRMTLEPHLGFYVDIDTRDNASNWFSLQTGAGFGIIDNLEAGMSLAMSLSPEVYAGMSMYGMYELGPFVSGKLFLAGKLSMHIPFSDYFVVFWPAQDFVMLAEGPVKFKIHDIFAVIGNFQMGFGIGTGNVQNSFLLGFELGALVAPIDPLALTFKFGVLGYLGDHSDEIVPMTFRGQYTIIGDLDFFTELTFMDLSNGADWIRLIFGAAYRIGF
jgi:hypothetical protein